MTNTATLESIANEPTKRKPRHPRTAVVIEIETPKKLYFDIMEQAKSLYRMNKPEEALTHFRKAAALADNLHKMSVAHQWIYTIYGENPRILNRVRARQRHDHSFNAYHKRVYGHGMPRAT